METILLLIVALIVIGACLYLFAQYVLPAIPLDPPLKAVIMALVALLAIIFLLVTFLGLPHHALR